MNAAAYLTHAGFRLALNPAGALEVAPATRLDDETRRYIRAHLVEIKRALSRSANDPAPRIRAWTVLFTDGRRCTAVNTTGADHRQMLAIAEDQFGPDRVLRVEPQQRGPLPGTAQGAGHE